MFTIYLHEVPALFHHVVVAVGRQLILLSDVHIPDQDLAPARTYKLHTKIWRNTIPFIE